MKPILYFPILAAAIVVAAFSIYELLVLTDLEIKISRTGAETDAISVVFTDLLLLALCLPLIFLIKKRIKTGRWR